MKIIYAFIQNTAHIRIFRKNKSNKKKYYKTMLKEVRTLRLQEERHPIEQDVWEAYEYANNKHCIVELEWFVPHYGMKKWVISPEDNIQDLLTNLHIV